MHINTEVCVDCVGGGGGRTSECDCMRGVSVLHPQNQTRGSAAAGGCKKYIVVEVGVGGYVKPVDERGREQAVDGGLLWHMTGRQVYAEREVYDAEV